MNSARTYYFVAEDTEVYLVLYKEMHWFAMQSNSNCLLANCSTETLGKPDQHYVPCNRKPKYRSRG